MKTAVVIGAGARNTQRGNCVATQTSYGSVSRWRCRCSACVVTTSRRTQRSSSSFDGCAFYLKQLFQSERVVECRLFGLPGGSASTGFGCPLASAR